jgi:hypothetical protein
MQRKLFVRLLVICAFLRVLASAYATGWFGPLFYFDEKEKRVHASPEFYWELEVKRLTRDFHPPEKLGPRDRQAFSANELDEGSGSREDWQNNTTAAADAADFTGALKEGRLAPPDVEEATRAAAAARAVLAQTKRDSTIELPAEFPGEFADYHRGAFAYRRGPDHWDEAQQIWKNLLERPEAERHYRTVWAAFMLGKIAMKRGDFAPAADWFARTRELAAQGFADSLGMAADSYGWQARCEWKQDHLEKAAPLFLTQLALGDESAIISLKAFVPDRPFVDRMLNFAPGRRDALDESDGDSAPVNEKEAEQLERCARDPLLRRLVTAQILAVASDSDEYFMTSENRQLRCRRWLEIIDSLKVKQVEDAEYLGWVAYNIGDYANAARWLEMAKPDALAGLWLRSKLQRRAGHLDAAAKSMARVWQILRTATGYTEWNGPFEPVDLQFFRPHWTFSESATGDLGALYLERTDYLQALETLLDGNLWEDASFVAERVLTTAELETFAEAHPPAAGASAEDWKLKLRYLLGRRLVREGHGENAAKFIPAPWNEVLKKYLAALHDAHEKNRQPRERAQSFFTAAWLARHAGMELMGTEGYPDGFVIEGDFEVPDLATQVDLPASARHRLTKSKAEPALRFHYRIIAARLALEAARLLPNDSEELADVLNTAGLWVKESDGKFGDRLYETLAARAGQTEIGRAVTAHHWFVDRTGPWSEVQKQSETAMRAALHIPEP